MKLFLYIGADDIQAIAIAVDLAKRKNTKILGITTVDGNANIN